ncbi:hypothetical protein BU26DRAFT_317565 [Trematosphaeria pertusa]|uniref:Uncharacterized protein n=1 Tax=Trematosphaeria pertusa TaxID=390896 RepID=A0A6A6IIH6_9PLEO|nr:uncharacterized protein BU26DRAFT_317565 [Trematosphaeria pertusa]KAF2249363.1 hypothetical protein BU26DRAFT_317565 [Trematosphaeria pertusa]
MQDGWGRWTRAGKARLAPRKVGVTPQESAAAKPHFDDVSGRHSTPPSLQHRILSLSTDYHRISRYQGSPNCTTFSPCTGRPGSAQCRCRPTSDGAVPSCRFPLHPRQEELRSMRSARNSKSLNLDGLAFALPLLREHHCSAQILKD